MKTYQRCNKEPRTTHPRLVLFGKGFVLRTKQGKGGGPQNKTHSTCSVVSDQESPEKCSSGLRLSRTWKNLTNPLPDMRNSGLPVRAELGTTRRTPSACCPGQLQPAAKASGRSHGRPKPPDAEARAPPGGGADICGSKVSGHVSEGPCLGLL